MRIRSALVRIWQLFRISSPILEDGTLLYRRGRDSFKYVEGDRAIEFEMLSGKAPDYVISVRWLEHWAPPHENETLPWAKRYEIAEKVRKAFKSHGMEVRRED